MGKILHLGIKQKTCYIRTIEESKKITPPKNKCFKNWESSSQAMVNALMFEGFNEAESGHGLRYLNLIDDGDSSVQTNIIENDPSLCKKNQNVLIMS